MPYSISYLEGAPLNSLQVYSFIGVIDQFPSQSLERKAGLGVARCDPGKVWEGREGQQGSVESSHRSRVKYSHRKEGRGEGGGERIWGGRAYNDSAPEREYISSLLGTTVPHLWPVHPLEARYGLLRKNSVNSTAFPSLSQDFTQSPDAISCLHFPLPCY
jgi:hypothetical protein